MKVDTCKLTVSKPDAALIGEGQSWIGGVAPDGGDATLAVYYVKLAPGTPSHVGQAGLNAALSSGGFVILKFQQDSDAGILVYQSLLEVAAARRAAAGADEPMALRWSARGAGRRRLARAPPRRARLTRRAVLGLEQDRRARPVRPLPRRCAGRRRGRRARRGLGLAAVHGLSRASGRLQARGRRREPPTHQDGDLAAYVEATMQSGVVTAASA